VRSLLIPLIALAWLGCGVLGARKIAQNLGPVKQTGDAIAALVLIVFGPITVIAYVLVQFFTGASSYKWLNRLLGFKAIILCLSAGLLGCGDIPRYETDQALRRTIFMECLKAVPPGPQYNDWDEVISECSSVAYYQAQVCVSGCGEAYNKGEK
jgi:hypothetical protein